MTLRSLYNEARRRLTASGIDSPAFDAACLIERVFGVTRGDLLVRGQEEADAAGEEQFEALLRRREAREPLQYLLGAWEFMDMRLKTGPGVLCPREETELLCQTVAGYLKDTPCRGLDLCAGTGAVALGIAQLCPKAEIQAVELSEQAAGYLRQNVETFGKGRVQVSMGDVLSPEFAARFADGSLDFIASNPPYIASGELPGLQEEVQKEPALALDGGEDGLVFYRAIAKLWAPKLRTGGVLAVEIGEEQAEAVSALFAEAGIACRTEQDFNGLDRVVHGCRTGTGYVTDKLK